MKKWVVEIVTDCNHKGHIKQSYGTAYCPKCGASRGAGGLWRRLVDAT